MTDFKVGDKVRFIRDNTNGGARFGHKGFETKITRVYDSGKIEVSERWLSCGFNPGAYAKDLELITEPARLKVGDRVVHAHYGAGVVSAVDTVETTLPYRVDFSDTFYQWVTSGSLTPENTTKTTEAPKAPAPAIERKFKVGDRVARRGDQYDIGTIVGQTHARNTVKWDDGLGNSSLWTDRELELAATPKLPAIVALIEHGQPKPSHRPYVHATTDAATKEAERLARKYPGQKFGVFQLVTARLGTVSVAEV